MLKEPFSHARLASVNPVLAGHAAFTALSNLQVFTPEQRVAGSALLFLALARHFGIHPENALQIAASIYTDQSGRANPELGALAMYLKHDLDNA